MVNQFIYLLIFELVRILQKEKMLVHVWQWEEQVINFNVKGQNNAIDNHNYLVVERTLDKNEKKKAKRTRY